jgi:hypothetical protein
LKNKSALPASVSTRPNNCLVELVKERGVKFRLTPDAERQLHQAGAYEKLILAVREAAR